ncbi:MAG: PAS domain-containing sensor histidine kinase, partial [Gammaproteobacteria bacterium]|nr:PAS domain-containing sensor histidine kinase [Gammaproteobacteria bacterium]
TPKEFEEQEKQQLEALQKTQRYGPYEKEYLHKSGARIPVLLNGLIIKKNNIPFIWSTIEDISIRKEAEKALIEAKNRAEIANKEKSRFLANMSHELRTPMHAILSFSKLANKRINDEKTSRFLDNIEASGQRLTGLLNALLDLSKIEAGKIELVYSKQNLFQITQQCISHISSLLQEKKLSINLDSDEEITAYFDPDLMSQVIINLLSNAIKYSPEGDSITIKLTSIEALPDTNFNGIVECVISDNGIGIPADELESVFENFTQSTTTDTKAGGTGLGLPICREIINMHYGAIWLESPVHEHEYGTGAHFIIPKIHSENITDNADKNNMS